MNPLLQKTKDYECLPTGDDDIYIELLEYNCLSHKTKKTYDKSIFIAIIKKSNQ